MVNFFFHKKKKFRPTSQNSRFPILRPNLRPLSGIENFFSQNLTYSYSFLGWNLPEMTMSLESLQNYFVITVKSRKNDKKFGFFEFWLWYRNNVEMIARSRQSPVNFTSKNTMITFFFQKKKKFRPASQNGRLSILRSNLRPLLEIDFFFFSKFNLLVYFFGVKFTGNYHVLGIIA